MLPSTRSHDQSRQSAVLKALCWHAQAQLTSARLCRWHHPQERMCGVSLGKVWVPVSAVDLAAVGVAFR